MKTALTQLLILLLCGFYPAVAGAAENAENPQKIDPALELIHVFGCKGCHTISGEGGSLAADLTQIGSRMTARQIESHLTADVSTRTTGFMPNYSSLAKEDLQRISKYLYNLQ